jgi:uncharacterized protein involved in type VI secretion and phage assembly
VSGQRHGGKVAQKAFSLSSAILVADRPIRTQAVADKLAQATLDRRIGRFIEAEGVSYGNPQLVAGASVKIDGVGTRFAGKYFVTGATHTYNQSQGYTTHFNVSGFQPSTLLSVIATENDGLGQIQNGLVIGIVTDNADPESMGRVKVKFPWLSAEHGSDWARVVTIGGGPGRGIQFLPEVNDEVLIGFEHGNVNYPYVLGGLWNGKDKPPDVGAGVIGGGKVKQRIIRSRTGHIITLDDSDDKPSITVVDNTGKNKVHLDSKKNNLSVTIEGDMSLEAPKGNILVKGKTINVEAQNALTIKGQSVDTQAQQALKMKAGTTAEMEGSAGVKVKGATADVEASAKLTLKGSAMVEVSGGMIKVG